MKALRLGLLLACGAMAAGCGCAPEMEGSAVSELTQSDPLEGAAGQGAEELEPEPESAPRSTDGSIIGLDGAELTGTVSFAAGTQWSGEVELFCCRSGSYTVFVYEGGTCGDPETWAVESSTRVAEVTCDHDVGSSAYVRDPSSESSAAFVIYDAAGNALGCADVETE
jgi:hypothetical protein